MSDSGSVKLHGVTELNQLLATFSDNVKRRATDSGLRKAGARLRTAFRRAAPRQSGTLRQSISSRFNKRDGKVYVGLSTRFYYKTLEFATKRGAPLHPFMDAAWKANRENIAQLIIHETTKELYREAGRIYARTKARNR
jgi:HK97 gp10 family phage protein